jgi:hypothetical protein
MTRRPFFLPFKSSQSLTRTTRCAGRRNGQKGQHHRLKLDESFRIVPSIRIALANRGHTDHRTSSNVDQQQAF